MSKQLNLGEAPPGTPEGFIQALEASGVYVDTRSRVIDALRCSPDWRASFEAILAGGGLLLHYQGDHPRHHQIEQALALFGFAPTAFHALMARLSPASA